MGPRILLCLAPVLLIALTVTSTAARVPEEPSDDLAPLVPSGGVEGPSGVGRHRPRPLGPSDGSSSYFSEGRQHGHAEVRPRGRRQATRPPWDLPAFPASPLDWAERGRRIGDYFRQMRMRRKFGWLFN